MREIKKILPTVRQAVLLFVNSNSARGLDCHENRDLACSCAITSRALTIILNRMGYKARLVCGHLVDCDLNKLNKDDLTGNDINHSWVEIGDYIIDLTASQFNTKKNKLFSEIIYTKDKSRHIKMEQSSHRSLKMFSEWGFQQIPRKKFVNRIIQNFEDLSRN